ncbi:hypothetical protein KQX54_002359 [Cotesia glomerata]|uniref:Uncharacterized protein n=1 Tax=Cotesia glomerata TaxID=32391 RepID=A0AAV7HH01_COTGL|nr:hypothetical protein KQX54_002359 [Cotesia glomerata]
MIESMPAVKNQRLIKALQRELDLSENEIGHWGNPITDYIARGIQLFDNSIYLERPENSRNTRSRMQDDVIENNEYTECQKREQCEGRQDQYSYDHHIYQTRGHIPRQGTYTDQYGDSGYLSTQHGTYQRQYQNPGYLPTQQSFYYEQQQFQNTQINQSSRNRNDLKLMAEKIKSMETLIRAKELKYEENTNPRQ